MKKHSKGWLKRQGSVKKRKNGFKVGHKCLHKKQKSAPVEKRERIVRNTTGRHKQCSVRTVNLVKRPGKKPPTESGFTRQEGLVTDNWMLRPEKTTTFFDQYRSSADDDGEYIIVHRGKNSMFWNRVKNEYSTQSPKCTGDLVYDTETRKPQGTVDIW